VDIYDNCFKEQSGIVTNICLMM